MIEVNLFDNLFIHTENMFGFITASDTLKPTKIKWIKGLMDFDGITVFTDTFVDSSIVDQVNCKIKVYWLLESKGVHPIFYEKIKEYENKFDYILTHDEKLLARSSKYIKSLVGASRILDNDALIYPKNKLISMIASNKQMTEGHKFRHEIASKFSNKYSIDMWGSGYKKFNNKLEPLKDYAYTISVMNFKNNNFFTEVLIDNFRTGTIPIFWGMDNINDFFDTQGILIFNTLEQLDSILKNISYEDYLNRIKSIENNLVLAKKYTSIDDLLANTLITLI